MITDKVIRDWLDLPRKLQTTFLVNEIYGKSLHREFHNAMKKYCAQMDSIKKRYYYLITFTLKPDIEEDRYKYIYKYIISRLQRTALQVEKAHIVEELTKKGIPHWHCSVVSKKYISKDRFKYYANKFGFVDISKNHSQNYKTMMDYISKEVIPIKIVGDISVT